MPFGAELRRFRIAAGLSLAQLGKAVHYTKGYLSRIENGNQAPNPALARQCDAVLNTGGALAALLPAPTTTIATPADRAEEWTLDVPASGAGRSLVVPHLPCCANIGWFPTAADDQRHGLAAAAGDGLTVDFFRTQFNQSVHLGELVSSRAILPTVTTHANTLWSLALVAPPTSRLPLMTLATLNATYAGWLALETGDDHAALRWSRTAVELAEMTGDTDLIVYALTREAGVAVFRDDPAHVLALTDRIRGFPRVATRFLRIAADREAQGHALLGNYDHCRRALDRSTDLSHVPDPTPLFGGALLPPMAAAGPHVVGVISGWCLHDLGRPTAAVEALDHEIAGIASTHRRATARFGARRVLAHAAAGDIDHACALAHELLGIAEVVDSATVRREFRRLARLLARWHNHQPVRELRPRLAAVLTRPMLRM